MSFAELDLHPHVVRRLADLGYRSPRPIQAQAAGPILGGRDVLGLAETGSGKTMAYAAPVVHRLMTERPAAPARPGRRPKGRPRPGIPTPESRLRALVICPTRELARQVAGEFDHLVQGSVLRCALVYGGVGMKPQAEAVAAGADIVVGVPGRILELLNADAMSASHLRHVIIDEADRLFDLGFRPQVRDILDRTPSDRQTLLFTATMPPGVDTLVGEAMRSPVTIEVGAVTTTVDHVRQTLAPMEDHAKIAATLHLLSDGPRRGVLIFCRTKRRVGWVAAALRRHDISTGVIHGDRTQAQRMRTLDQFAAGDLRVVVATDVAARGLHIPSVRTVINYDAPVLPEEYVHRVGRAGHGGGFGESFTLLNRGDERHWSAIMGLTGVRLERSGLDGFDPPRPPKGRKGKDRSHEPAPAAWFEEDAADSGRGGRGSDEDGGGRRKRRGGDAPRRSRASRSLRNERPGKGVKRRPRRDANGDGDRTDR